MKKFTILLVSLTSGLLLWALDHPYTCTETVTCESSCTSASATCLLSGTLPYETECKNDSIANLARCIVVKKGTTIVVAQTESACRGCGEGSPDEGCEPGSGTWWIGCDPFAY